MTKTEYAHALMAFGKMLQHWGKVVTLVSGPRYDEQPTLRSVLGQTFVVHRAQEFRVSKQLYAYDGNLGRLYACVDQCLGISMPNAVGLRGHQMTSFRAETRFRGSAMVDWPLSAPLRACHFRGEKHRKKR